MDRPLPLREHLHAVTRSRIAEAALDVAEDVGVSELRAEDVAVRAGVSRRTFFNYVSGTSAALVIPIEDYLAAIGREFGSRPASEGVVASMSAALEQVDPDVVARCERALLVLADAGSANPASLEAWDRSEQAIRDLIINRVPGAEPLRVSVLAAALMGSGRAAAEAWALDARPPGGGTARRTRRRTLTVYLTRALGYLASLEDGRPG